MTNRRWVISTIAPQADSAKQKKNTTSIMVDKQGNGKSSKPIIPLFIEHNEKVHYD